MIASDLANKCSRRTIVVHDDVQGIKVLWVSAVTQGQGFGQATLQGREAKTVVDGRALTETD